MMGYKELRMLIITLVLDLAIVAGMIYFGLNGQRSKIIIGAVFLLITLPMTLIKFNCRLFNDSMMIYHLRAIGIVPALVDYKDIKEHKLISKHKVYFKHKSRSTLYLVNAQAFYEDFLEKYNEYTEYVNKKED